MARTTYVKSARERFDADGNRKPDHTCDKCSAVIEPGMPYKHRSIKTGPRSSRLLVRCAPCPEWHVWEYSQSLSARTAQISHEARLAVEDAEDKESVEAVLQAAAESIRELAEEKREAASNMEEGFGHETSQSSELNDTADQLDEWADSVESADVPEVPDAEDAECEECEGQGSIKPQADGKDTETPDGELVPCDECSGSGHPSEPTEDQLDDWRSEVEDATAIIDECPV
jgi:RNase P subunit RPR2